MKTIQNLFSRLNRLVNALSRPAFYDIPGEGVEKTKK
ncbi:Uncharacterised protein [Leminorella grimontii]|nr:Uncharacterised protein [Leminorella grimontii]